MRFDRAVPEKLKGAKKMQNLSAYSFRRLLTSAYRPLAAGLLSLMLVVPAWAAVQTNITFPVSGTVFNPCNGETLNFSGVAHFISSVTLSSNGGFHLVQNDNIHVTATGDQGNKYVGNEEDSFQLNAVVGAEETATDIFTEISQGPAPNFVVKAVFHITVHPDGTVTAFVNDFTAQCK